MPFLVHGSRRAGPVGGIDILVDHIFLRTLTGALPVTADEEKQRRRSYQPASKVRHCYLLRSSRKRYQTAWRPALIWITEDRRQDRRRPSVDYGATKAIKQFWLIVFGASGLSE
jgi:hypothetical protein